MGSFEFLEILSKIFPLIKVEDKSTKIIIKGDSIIIGDQITKDPGKRKEFLSELKKYKREESLPYQVIHKDLLQDYIEYEEISKSKLESLLLLKEVLSLDELECILMARRIQIAFEKNDKSLVDKLYNQLEKHYPKKGRKVANLIKAGYFDELIIPMIGVCKNLHGDKYKEKFREFYNNILTFFPTAIFVNSEITEEILEEEIYKRLKLKTIPMIRIHSMGKENIIKVEKVIEKIKEKLKFDIENKKFITSTGIEAQNLEIKIKKNYIH